MKIIAGLGNPGKKYEHTRHNAGFMLLDHLHASWRGTDWKVHKNAQAEICKKSAAFSPGFGFFDFTLVRPQTYMNRSGESIRAILGSFDHDGLVVAFDDLDLPLGAWKLQMARGPHGHNGLESIYSQLGTKDFWHLRIGIDGRGGNRGIPSQAYVLSQFLAVERGELEQVFAQIEAELHITLS